ncbi:hypothetical protein [Acrocarpospora sp. B8E8]
MLVGDAQRVIDYAALGFAVSQSVPDDVADDTSGWSRPAASHGSVLQS